MHKDRFFVAFNVSKERWKEIFWNREEWIKDNPKSHKLLEEVFGMKRWNGKKMSHGKKNLNRPLKGARQDKPKQKSSQAP